MPGRGPGRHAVVPRIALTCRVWARAAPPPRATWSAIVHNPFVPETLEGWGLLHQTFRIRWHELRRLSAAARTELAAEAVALIRDQRRRPRPRRRGEHRRWRQRPHRPGADARSQGRPDARFTPAARFDELGQAQLAWSRSQPARLASEPTMSYVSIVELGMYEMTAKIHEQLGEQGLTLGERRVRAGVRHGDGSAEGARDEPSLASSCRSGATSASIR